MPTFSCNGGPKRQPSTIDPVFTKCPGPVKACACSGSMSSPSPVIGSYSPGRSPHESFQPRTVDIQFEASDLGTHLTIEHTHGDDVDERQGYIDGWKFFIERLRGVLPTD